MAVTSIWSIKGNSSIGRVVNYAKNAEKTTNPNFEHDTKNWLSRVIEYAMNDSKTIGKIGAFHEESAPILRQFVTGINCLPDTAQEEMTAVKAKYGKTDGVVAYHGYQSFASSEGTPEIVHEIGVKLAERLWGERFQVVVATHLDHANHLHNHFVVNTVSFIDGKKYHRTKADYWQMAHISDELCREYGLSVIEKQSGSRTKRYDEWLDEKNAAKPENKAKIIIHAQFNGKSKSRHKVTGLIALYFHYLYRIGYFSYKRQMSAKRIYFLYHKDIRKMREIVKEIQYLGKYEISTDEQLSVRVEQIKEKIFTLTEIKYKTAETKAQIAELRQEARLCENIRKRVLHIKEIKSKSRKTKEVSENEQFGRRGGAGHSPDFGGR